MLSPTEIALSALQHYLYCPRQCALIHTEQMWVENLFTAEGRLLHQRSDQPRSEARKLVRQITAMPLASEKLGICGVADMVEFHASPEGERILPVEYKRGRPKKHRADEVQLCAQALCLEDMMSCHIEYGALYYGKNRRRTIVQFNSSLRELTLEVIRDARAMVDSGVTPLPEYQASKCERCSLFELCQPKAFQGRKIISAWLKNELQG
jgi:CRISPR-associated exonuclease Cas4